MNLDGFVGACPATHCPDSIKGTEQCFCARMHDCAMRANAVAADVVLPVQRREADRLPTDDELERWYELDCGDES